MKNRKHIHVDGFLNASGLRSLRGSTAFSGQAVVKPIATTVPASIRSSNITGSVGATPYTGGAVIPPSTNTSGTTTGSLSDLLSGNVKLATPVTGTIGVTRTLPIVTNPVVTPVITQPIVITPTTGSGSYGGGGGSTGGGGGTDSGSYGGGDAAQAQLGGNVSFAPSEDDAVKEDGFIDENDYGINNDTELFQQANSDASQIQVSDTGAVSTTSNVVAPIIKPIKKDEPVITYKAGLVIVLAVGLIAACVKLSMKKKK